MATDRQHISTMNSLLGKGVPERPKEQARYSIRELLILGLTLPVRFCPINKFGPEALGLDIVSLERMSESLMHYEREQLKQWRQAQLQARKKINDADATRAKQDKEKANGTTSSRSEMDGDNDKTMIDDIGTTSGPKVQRNLDVQFRNPGRQDALHFQIPSSHSGAPVNINIGLSLDYTSLPRHHTGTDTENVVSRYPWASKPKQTSNLSQYLKDAPVADKPAPSEPTKVSEPQPHSTPPQKHILPDQHIVGGETPNSMAVERATEPSVRSYSPTSSLPAPSEAEEVLSISPGISPASPIETIAEEQESQTPTPGPISESVAPVAPEESPETEVTPPAAINGDFSASKARSVSISGSEGTWSFVGTSRPVSGEKNLLGKGKIDAKVQDDFINFMLGKK